jgi:hypothetical protein
MKGMLRSRCRVAVLIAAMSLVAILQARVLAAGLVYNYVIAGLQKYDSALAWGLGDFTGYSTDLSVYETFSLELPNPNWPQSSAQVGYLRSLASLLRGLQRLGANPRQARLLARLEAYGGEPQRAWDTLQRVMSETQCTDLLSRAPRCIGVWVDTGDALDGLGHSTEALDYYRAAGWFRRREAATELLLQMADETTDPSARKSALVEARNLAPDALVVRLSELSLGAGNLASLRAPGDPRLALPVRRDPRLEQRQAEAIVMLVESGVWDEETLGRVLQFRAWQMDLYSMTYRNVRVIKEWTTQEPADPWRVRALLAFFDDLATRLPADPSVSTARAEAYTRADAAEERVRLDKAAARPGLSSGAAARESSVSPQVVAAQQTLPSTLDGRYALASTNFDIWWSYGQAKDVYAAPSTEAGYDDALVGWVWGPDTERAFEDQPSFRADCIWSESVPGKRNAVLIATWLQRGGGRALPIQVPAGNTLVIDYWWQAQGDIRLAYRGAEPIVRQEGGGAGEWVHSSWVYPSANIDRTIAFAWEYSGCGTFWLGKVSATIARGVVQ